MRNPTGGNIEPLRTKRLKDRLGVRLVVGATLLVSSTLILQPRISDATTKSVVVVSAGDISCSQLDPNYSGKNPNYCQQQRTAALVQSINPSYLLPGGDTQYPPTANYSEGQQPSISEYAGGYGASWGQLQNPASPLYVPGLIVRPTTGGHEYGDFNENDRGLKLSTGSNYYSYFGPTGLNDLPAGVTQPSNDFYSFNIPVGTTTWHIISLDSECAALPGPGGTTPSGSATGCAAGSPEETFLQNDLAANQGACTIIHWHEPLNSTFFGYDSDYQAFWDDAAKYHVTLIVNGHDHDYERWVPMNAAQVPSASGVTQIIAGTGGDALSIGTHPNSNIAFSDFNDFGVLQLTLNSTSADYAFKTVSGTTPDSGTLNCQELSATTVTSVGPSSGRAAGTSVTITGTNLANASAVDFGTTAATITADSATSITVTAPSGSGTVDVTVTTTGGTSATSSHDKFTYASTPPHAPTVLRVTPRGLSTILTWSAPANDGGAPVTGYRVGEAASKTATGGKLLDVKPLAGSKRTFVLDNLPKNFRGYFFVAAINANGVGTRQWHRFVNGRVPFAPMHLSVTSEGTSTNLTWSAPANDGGFAITGYQVREVTTKAALSDGGQILNRRPLSAKSRHFKITNLSASFNGYFVVLAINARGAGNRAWRHFP
jgi:IPT/TIG domain/Calcineurin-like phosphoesterase